MENHNTDTSARESVQRTKSVSTRGFDRSRYRHRSRCLTATRSPARPRKGAPSRRVARREIIHRPNHRSLSLSLAPHAPRSGYETVQPYSRTASRDRLARTSIRRGVFDRARAIRANQRNFSILHRSRSTRARTPRTGRPRPRSSIVARASIAHRGARATCAEVCGG